MAKVIFKQETGSILVMAVVLAFATTILGLSYISVAYSFTCGLDYDIRKLQARYDSYSGAVQGLIDYKNGNTEHGAMRYFYDGNYFGYKVIPSGFLSAEYGVSEHLRIVGKGLSEGDGGAVSSETILINRRNLSFADFVYLSHRERDSLRHVIIRFWTPDTLDGLVHSNDTIHIFGSPLFRERVTSSTGINPGDARFERGYGYRSPITFPDHADEIRRHSIYDWGTIGPDSVTQLVLSGHSVKVRKCGLFNINGQDSIRCFPSTIAQAPLYDLASINAIFVNGKAWISASRGRIDRMDGEYPERSIDDGGFISEGFSGMLSIGSSDTMILTDNIIYQNAKPDFSVPSTLDSCADILGLVSERYIMIGKGVADTVYINAAMAAVTGSISVQDIYMNRAPGWDNEKQSLVVWGSLAQRNRGIIHTSDYPPGHLRGFIEKDYNYDKRFVQQAPPYYPETSKSDLLFLGEL